MVVLLQVGKRVMVWAFRKRLGSVREDSCSLEAPESCPEPHPDLDFEVFLVRFFVDFGSIFGLYL